MHSILILKPACYASQDPQHGHTPTKHNPANSIAIIFLTEAHAALPTPLCHADMVHHEQVDVQVICTSPPHTEQRCPNIPDQLDTAPLTLHYRRHVLYP